MSVFLVTHNTGNDTRTSVIGTGKRNRLNEVHKYTTIETEIFVSPQDKKAPGYLNQYSMLSLMASATKLSSENPEKNKTIFQNVLHTSALPTLGHTFCKH